MRSVLVVESGQDQVQCQVCRGLVSAVKEMTTACSVHTSVLGTSVATVDVVVLGVTNSEMLETAMTSYAGGTGYRPILAVVCRSQLEFKNDLVPLLSKVDDFLFCTNRDSELAVRLERLLDRSGGQISPGAELSGKAGKRTNPIPSLPSDRLPMIGEDSGFLAAVNLTKRFALSDATVLIAGETGSGKELFARAIHYQSGRRAKPFIPVNCGALPDQLFENELFGHAKGAYTDASSAEQGLIAEAEGGTLFLDEIDGLSASAQVKLLRFLQSGEYRPLGAARAQVANVRVLAAANCDLRARVEAKLFREDLFYRLNILAITVPPLRERGQDVLRLAEYFVAGAARSDELHEFVLTAAARQKLLNYSWPGNVRELAAVMERAMVLCGGGPLQAADIELPKGACREAFEKESLRKAKSLVVREFESRYVTDLLVQHQGNITQAAKAAGKDRRTLQRLVRKYALDRLSFTKG